MGGRVHRSRPFFSRFVRCACCVAGLLFLFGFFLGFLHFRLHNVRTQIFEIHLVHLLAFAGLFSLKLRLCFFNILCLLLSPALDIVIRALLCALNNAKVIVQTLLSNTLAPAVAFYLFYVVFVLLAVSKALITLYSVIKVVKLLLLVVMLLNGFVLLHTPALLEL